MVCRARAGGRGGGGQGACAATMVSASHWVGLTLPGMMLLPGSFSGSNSSPSPHRGPLPAPHAHGAPHVKNSGETDERKQ